MLDPDMALMANIRAKGEFIYVTNRLNFGHLVNAEDFETSHLHNELWEMERNRYDWELRYLHPNYSASVGLENPEQPCPDVYWFPMFTERFCADFVAEAEHFGKWSDGSNKVRIRFYQLLMRISFRISGWKAAMKLCLREIFT